MSSKTHVTVDGATYNAAEVASKPFDEFKSDALEQVKANPSAGSLHFCHWGDQQIAKLKEVWDKAVALIKPTAPVKTEDKKLDPPKV